MLCRLSDLRDKEVVNINNGSCMGCVSDVDTEDTKVTLLQAPAGMAEAFVFWRSLSLSYYANIPAKPD